MSKHCPNLFENVAKGLSKKLRYPGACILYKNKKGGDCNVRIDTARHENHANLSVLLDSPTRSFFQPPHLQTVETVSIFSCKTQQWSVLVGPSPSLSNTISDHGGGSRAVTQLVPLCSGVDAIGGNWSQPDFQSP